MRFKSRRKKPRSHIHRSDNPIVICTDWFCAEGGNNVSTLFISIHLVIVDASEGQWHTVFNSFERENISEKMKSTFKKKQHVNILGAPAECLEWECWCFTLLLMNTMVSLLWINFNQCLYCTQTTHSHSHSCLWNIFVSFNFVRSAKHFRSSYFLFLFKNDGDVEWKMWTEQHAPTYIQYYVVPMFTFFIGSSLFIRFFSCFEGFVPSERKRKRKILYTKHNQTYTPSHSQKNTPTHTLTNINKWNIDKASGQTLSSPSLARKKRNRYLFPISISVQSPYSNRILYENNSGGCGSSEIMS